MTSLHAIFGQQSGKDSNGPPHKARSTTAKLPNQLKFRTMRLPACDCVTQHAVPRLVWAARPVAPSVDQTL